MKVLVVDDEAILRKSLGRALEFKGHQVILATNGQEGLQKWRNENPDVVFLDVIMPELTGPQVLEELGNARTGKVILMSAYAPDRMKELTERFAVDLFLPKPFEDIFQVVAQAERLGK